MSNFKEGKEHFIWLFNHSTKEENLAIATLHACDHCKRPATVNCVWVMNSGKNLEKAKEQATKLKKEYNGTFTELGADDNGDCFCEDCYPEHANTEAS